MVILVEHYSDECLLGTTFLVILVANVVAVRNLLVLDLQIIGFSMDYLYMMCCIIF